MRVGGIVFLAGVVAVLVVVLPFFFGARNWPLALNLVAGLVPPIGVGISLWGLVRNARAARARRQLGCGRLGRGCDEPVTDGRIEAWSQPGR